MTETRQGITHLRKHLTRPVEKPVDNYDDAEHDAPTPPHTYARHPFLSAMIRGGLLRPSEGALPSIHGDRTYTLRLDAAPHGTAPYAMAVWVSVELSEAERRQWAQVLLEGL